MSYAQFLDALLASGASAEMPERMGRADEAAEMRRTAAGLRQQINTGGE